MRGSRVRPALRLTALLACVTLARPLSGAEIAGVTVPGTVTVGGEELKLNGTALLKKLVFRVYVVALYLPTPTHDPAAVVGPDVPKALVVQFLRPVSREALVAPLERDFARNSGEQGRRARGQIARLLAVVKDMKRGDRLTFTYEPGKGSTITMTDGTRATFEGKDFADSFLLIYVGPRPPKEEMKRRLLGRA